MKLYETKKLHYGKYLYKLVLHNSLNVIFRTEFQKDGHLSYARQQLDKYTEDYRQGIPITRQIYRGIKEVTNEEYIDAKTIYTLLKKAKDYKIRVDPWGTLTIYTNNKKMCMSISNKIYNKRIEFWEPNPENVTALLNVSNIIISDVPTDFPIKVTLGRGRIPPMDFANWLKSNRDKSRVGNKALDIIERGGWCDGLYFYVRDEKVLSLVHLLVGANIRRIDKIVYKGNLDKY